MTPYAFQPARVVARRVETEGIYTFGVGEVPISIVSDPDEPHALEGARGHDRGIGR